MGQAGWEGAFWLDNSSPTLTDISTYLNNVDFPEDIGVEDTSTFGTQPKTYTVTQTDGTITISGPWDSTLDAHLNGVKGQAASLSYEYGPEGGDTGDVKYSGECFMTSYGKSGSVGGVAQFTASFQCTGAITVGTF